MSNENHFPVLVVTSTDQNLLDTTVAALRRQLDERFFDASAIVIRPMPIESKSFVDCETSVSVKTQSPTSIPLDKSAVYGLTFRKLDKFTDMLISEVSWQFVPQVVDDYLNILATGNGQWSRESVAARLITPALRLTLTGKQHRGLVAAAVLTDSPHIPKLSHGGHGVLTTPSEEARQKRSTYVTVKLIEAEPEERNGEAGYRVYYPDGYVSWCPKKQFEDSAGWIGE